MPKAMKAKEVSKSVCRLCGKQKMCRVLNYTAPRCRRPRRVPVCYECVSDDNVMPNVAYIIKDKMGREVKMSNVEKLLKEIVSQQSQMLAIMGDKFRFLNKEEHVKKAKEQVLSGKSDKKKVKKESGESVAKSSITQIVKALEEVGLEVRDDGKKTMKIYNGDEKVGVTWQNGRLEHKVDKEYSRVSLEEFISLEGGATKSPKKVKKVKKDKVAKKVKKDKKGKKAKKAKKG